MTDEVAIVVDANGEAMVCEGCGSTLTIAAILKRHGPKAIACCSERKMVQARYYWERASAAQSTAVITRLVEALERAGAYINGSAVADHEMRQFIRAALASLRT